MVVLAVPLVLLPPPVLPLLVVLRLMKMPRPRGGPPQPRMSWDGSSIGQAMGSKGREVVRRGPRPAACSWIDGPAWCEARSVMTRLLVPRSRPAGL